MKKIKILMTILSFFSISSIANLSFASNLIQDDVNVVNVDQENRDNYDAANALRNNFDSNRDIDFNSDRNVNENNLNNDNSTNTSGTDFNLNRNITENNLNNDFGATNPENRNNDDAANALRNNFDSNRDVDFNSNRNVNENNLNNDNSTNTLGTDFNLNRNITENNLNNDFGATNPENRNNDDANALRTDFNLNRDVNENDEIPSANVDSNQMLINSFRNEIDTNTTTLYNSMRDYARDILNIIKEDGNILTSKDKILRKCSDISTKSQEIYDYVNSLLDNSKYDSIMENPRVLVFLDHLQNVLNEIFSYSEIITEKIKNNEELSKKVKNYILKRLTSFANNPLSLLSNIIQ